MAVPKIWGQGSLFAFSALDGKAQFSTSLVGSLSGDRVGVRFHLKTQRELALCIPSGIPFSLEAVTGDLILISANGEKSGFAFAEERLLVGKAASPVSPRVFAEGDASEERLENAFILEADGEWTALMQEGDAFAFAFAFSREEAMALCRKGLTLSFEKLAEKRMQFFEKNVVPDDHPYAALAAKCLSVMKTQLYSPEGRFLRVWSTPNRYPHKRLWLWDSVFHAIGHRHVHPQVAEDLILAVLDTQREDGFIPHMSTPEKSSRFTQPPVLAWGAWLVYEKTKNAGFLEKVYHANKRFLSWCDENRRIEGSLLYTWATQANERCRCDECGMDNSPRFDPITRLLAIDFSCYMANEARFMAKLARLLRLPREEWDEKYDLLSREINAQLYDEEDGFYYDYDFDGKCLLKVRAVSSFLPLFVGICPPDRAEKLVAALTDPEDFGSPLPIPSISKKDPSYGSDMWRGPFWINYNYMISLGLEEYGFSSLAHEIRAKTLAELNRHYKAFGTIYEFYDPEGLCPPHHQYRKGNPSPFYGLSAPTQAIRDYGWSCTLAYELLAKQK